MEPASKKRVLDWHECFMSMAETIARRSKDPVTQVGACIVGADNIIMGLGYNGFPRGCNDHDFPWEKQADHPYDTKYMYVVHAEANAILNSNSIKLTGCTLYVTRYPCHECAKLIIQAGIKKIYYQTDKNIFSDSHIAAEKMFRATGIHCEQYPATVSSTKAPDNTKPDSSNISK